MNGHEAKHGVGVLLACVLAGMAAGQTQDKDTIERLGRMQKTYETELSKIETASDQKLNALRDQYVKSLGALQATMQKAGKLDPLLLIRAERERFSAAKSVEETDLKPELPELCALQKQYVTAAREREGDRAQQIVDLAGKYEKALETLSARLTQAGSIESALKVKQARDALAARGELAAARFVLADAEANAPAAPPAEENPPELKKPGPADLLSKRSSPRKESDKRQISKRYNAFCDALAEEDFEGALACADPRVVKQVGTAALKPHFALLSTLLKGAKAAGVTFDAGHIEVDTDAGTAVNIPKVRIFNKVKDGDPTYWVLVDDEWYVDFSKGKKNKEKGE